VCPPPASSDPRAPPQEARVAPHRLLALLSPLQRAALETALSTILLEVLSDEYPSRPRPFGQRQLDLFSAQDRPRSSVPAGLCLCAPIEPEAGPGEYREPDPPVPVWKAPASGGA
jgi:hypothetical protein